MTAFEQEFRIRARLDGLMTRMLLTGLAGVVLCVVGVFGLRPALRYGLAVLAGGTPEVPDLHVPPQLQSYGFAGLLAMMFWCFLAVSLAGLSSGALPRRKVLLALLITASTGIMAVSLADHTEPPLFVLPSKLEREVNQGRLSSALLWLKDSGTDLELIDSVNYVRAQIALRDKSGTLPFAETAGPVLDYTDKVLYTQRSTLRPEGHPGLQGHPVGQFRAEVLYALDHRLNGEPRSAVGIQFEQHLAREGIAGPRAAALRTLVLRGGLLLLGMLLCRLWWVMARRIEDIELMLQPAEPLLAPVPVAAMAAPTARAPVTGAAARAAE